MCKSILDVFTKVYKSIQEYTKICEYLDCQGLITSSSGPPISTTCFTLRKFSLQSAKSDDN